MRPETAVRRLYGRYNGGGSAADGIHDTIAEAIVSRALPAGWRLREENLASIFAVSRTPVREALMRLESERLVTRSRRSGLVVADVSAEQVLELYVIREALDGVAARQAARYHAPVDIATLEEINVRMQIAADADDFSRMAELNVDFHTALARASRNEMLQQFVAQVNQAVRRYRGTTFAQPGRAREAILEHEQIIEALRGQDEQRAEEAARRHMRHALLIRLQMEQAS